MVSPLLIALIGLLALPVATLAPPPEVASRIDETYEGVQLCGVVGTLKGIAGKFSSGGGGGNVSMDVGILTMVSTFDNETDQLISRDIILERGPHPVADSDFTTVFDGFLAALG